MGRLNGTMCDKTSVKMKKDVVRRDHVSRIG